MPFPASGDWSAEDVAIAERANWLRDRLSAEGVERLSGIEVARVHEIAAGLLLAEPAEQRRLTQLHALCLERPECSRAELCEQLLTPSDALGGVSPALRLRNS